MKSTIIHLTIATMVLLGTIPRAEARSHHSACIYISGYTSCGAPIYVERYFIGYDRCGNEIWGKRVIRREYRPRYVAPCPPLPCHIGFTIQGSLRR